MACCSGVRSRSRYVAAPRQQSGSPRPGWRAHSPEQMQPPACGDHRLLSRTLRAAAPCSLPTHWHRAACSGNGSQWREIIASLVHKPSPGLGADPHLRRDLPHLRRDAARYARAVQLERQVSLRSVAIPGHSVQALNPIGHIRHPCTHEWQKSVASVRGGACGVRACACMRRTQSRICACGRVPEAESKYGRGEERDVDHRPLADTLTPPQRKQQSLLQLVCRPSAGPHVATYHWRHDYGPREPKVQPRILP